MTGHDIVAWRQAHQWNQNIAAARLGITRRTIQRWEASTTDLPAYVPLACAQIDTEEAAKAPEPAPEGDTHKQLDWLNGDFRAQMPRIMAAIQKHGPLTRQEIADITGIPLPSVCGRARKLLDALLLEHGERDTSHGGFPRWKLQPWGTTKQQNKDRLEARRA